MLHMFDVNGDELVTELDKDGFGPYYQAAFMELGMYKYEFDILAHFIKDTTVFRFNCVIPDTTKSYNPEPIKEVYSFLQNKAKNILFIYGSNDIWYADKIQLETEWAKSHNSVYVLEKADHDTYIESFPKKVKKEIFNLLEEWTGETIYFEP